MSIDLYAQPHPLFYAIAFRTELPAPLGMLSPSPSLFQHLQVGATAPVACDANLRDAVRGMLRHGGFKPSGRSKPASEYLVRAVEQGTLPSINLAVDACNAASYHSGIPISVVDLTCAAAPLRLAIAPQGASYVFNAAGQELDLGGLLCLHDAQGPCANAVKDAQRTKTSTSTVRTLSVLWCPSSHRDLGQRTAAWYRALLEEHGAATYEVEITHREP